MTRVQLTVDTRAPQVTLRELQEGGRFNGLVLGAVVAQVEFAKVTIESWRALNTWALYTEYQLWFISSDVEGGTVSKLSFGLRIGLL